MALAPQDAQAQYAVARPLLALGAYDEALDIYRNIGRRWPDEAFDVAIRTGALHRQRGDHQGALRQLDDYARAHPDSANGMRFHYHRAWTLTLLERFEEAEREIDNGFSTQPDYASAYQLRACARARLGRLEGALADEERALEIMGGHARENSVALRADMARSRTVIESLRTAIRQGRATPMAAPCDGFWDRWIRPRPRSPLLPAVSGQPN